MLKDFQVADPESETYWRNRADLAFKYGLANHKLIFLEILWSVESLTRMETDSWARRNLNGWQPTRESIWEKLILCLRFVSIHRVRSKLTASIINIFSVVIWIKTGVWTTTNSRLSFTATKREKIWTRREPRQWSGGRAAKCKSWEKWRNLFNLTLFIIFQLI